MTVPVNNGSNPLAYEGTKAINPPNFILASRAPTTTDFQDPGTFWLNSATNSTYTAGVPASGAAVWNICSGATGVVDALAGDSGSATPSGGSITIAGGSNITTSAASHTVTVALASTITGLTALTATTLNGTTITTNVATAELSLSGTTITATGSNSNVSLNLSTKGSGSVVFSRSAASVDINMQITNSDNTSGTSNGGIQLAVGGASGGDPYTLYTVSGATSWITGIDNSASDAYVVAASTALGTSNAASWSTAGALTNTGAITVTAGDITATNGNVVLGTAGNKIKSTSVASTTTAGANSFGTVTLVSGTATIATTAVTASSIIFLTRMSIGSTGANPVGALVVGTVTANTSFVINAVQTASASSVETNDVSVVGWMIVN